MPGFCSLMRVCTHMQSGAYHLMQSDTCQLHVTARLAQAVTSINGVLINKINLEHKGTYTVTGNQSGYAAKMKLHASGMLTSRSKMHEASSLLLKRPVRRYGHPGTRRECLVCQAHDRVTVWHLTLQCAHALHGGCMSPAHLLCSISAF